MNEGPTVEPDPSDPPSLEDLRAWLVRSGDVPSDEMGVTARLEARGFTDSTASRHYGAADLFVLSEELLAGLASDRPRRPTDRADHARPVSGHVTRGITYLVPAALIVLATGADAGTTSVLWFAGLTCVGWGTTQALARVAYVALGRGGLEAAGRYLARVLVAGVLVAMVVGALVAAAVGSSELGLVVGAQVGYLVLSAVVLPQRREVLLVVAMAPALVATVAVLAADVPVTAAAVLAVGGEVLVAALVLPRLARAAADAALRPDRHDALDAAPVLALGAATGAFVLGVTFVVADGVGTSGPVVALAVVLTACMGVAEVQIAVVRSQLDRTLRRSTTADQFTATARRILAAHSLAFVTVLLVALGVTAVLSGLPVGLAVAAWAAMVVLGCCLYLNLCLLIVEHVLPGVVAFCGAAALLIAALVLSDDVGPLAIVVAAGTAAGLWLAVRTSVARPYGHVAR